MGKLGLWSLIWVLSACLLAMACSTGKDGDSDAADDDTGPADDDGAGDDDSGAFHPCEGRYDVIIRGDYAGQFAWITTWTSKYIINEDGTTVGIVIPDAPGWATYDAVGLRTSPGVGYSDGSFPTPQDLQSYCNSGTVQIHVDYSTTDGLFQGTAAYHCTNPLGPFTVFGYVACGNP